jgi:thioester reductase-like protein
VRSELGENDVPILVHQATLSSTTSNIKGRLVLSLNQLLFLPDSEKEEKLKVQRKDVSILSEETVLAVKTKEEVRRFGGLNASQIKMFKDTLNMSRLLETSQSALSVETATPRQIDLQNRFYRKI